MPFYKVTARTMLIEASTPSEAAMSAYRMFEDCTPHGFEVVGPDAEVNNIALDADQRDQAISIEFGRKATSR